MSLIEKYIFNTLKKKIIENEKGEKQTLCIYIALYDILPEEDLCENYNFNCHKCTEYVLEKVEFKSMLKEFLKLKKDSLSALAKNLGYCEHCKLKSSKRCKECISKEKIYNALSTFLKKY